MEKNQNTVPAELLFAHNLAQSEYIKAKQQANRIDSKFIVKTPVDKKYDSDNASINLLASCCSKSIAPQLLDDTEK